MKKQYELINLYFRESTDKDTNIFDLINSIDNRYNTNSTSELRLQTLLPGRLESHQHKGSYHLHLIDKKTNKRIDYRLTKANGIIYIEPHSGQIKTKKDPIKELFNSKGSIERIIKEFEKFDESEFTKPSKNAIAMYDLVKKKRIA